MFLTLGYTVELLRHSNLRATLIRNNYFRLRLLYLLGLGTTEI